MANKKLTDLSALSPMTSGTVFLVDDSGTTQTVTGSVIKSYITSSDMVVSGNITSAGSLVPSTSNTYTLGTPTKKWADMYIGPNSIHIQDTANSANTGILTVTNGILQVNGLAGLQANLIAGNTTLTLAPNGNINMSVAGTSNVLQVTSSNVIVNGNSYANYFIGNGYSLNNIAGANVTGYVPNANVANTAYAVTGSNVTGAVAYATTANSVAGANVSGQVGNALVAGTVYTNAQPNITSVGTLSSLAVTGNVTAGNANVTGQLISTVATGTPPLVVTSTTTVANLSVATATTAGTLTTAAQPNITSVGTLTSLAVTGSVTAGNLYANTGNANIGNLTVNGTLTASSIAGIGTLADGNSNVNVVANGNINLSATGTANVLVVTSTGANVTGYANVTGNINGANIIGNHIGNGSALSSITGANVSGAVAFATTANSVAGANVSGAVAFATTANSVAGANVSGQVGNALVAGTVYTNAQPNITSVGTLSSLIVTANITSGNANLGNAVTANYFIGNGSQLTGIGNTTALVNGTSNVIVTASGNINMSVTGVANLLQVTSNATKVNGNLVVTSNTGGTATSGAISISADGTSITPQNPGVMLSITGQGSNPARVYIDGVGTNNYAAFIGRHYNGTSASPSQLLNNDVISRYGATPYATGGWPAISTTRMDMIADENQTATNQGSRIEFWLTPTGSNTIQQQVTFNTTGANINGNLNVSGDITVSGNINLVPGTFGQFANVANITAPGSNTPATILWTTSIASNGVSYTSGNSRITVNKADTYRISYNTSMLGNGASPIGYFWLRKNGTDIPNSMTTAATTGTVQHQVTGTVVIALASSDYIELAWAVSDNTKATLVAYAANSTFTHPASPSASISILPVSV